MTPRVLNRLIRAGEFFWVADPLATQTGYSGQMERQALAAKSVQRGERKTVRVRTEIGWVEATHVRRAGSQSPIPLEHEGQLTWAMN